VKIILAEDNPVNAQLLKIIAQSLGFDLDLAVNGKQLLEKMSETRYEKVLMDLSMPVMDGIEAARRIRAGEAGAHHKDVPIIAVTAHDSQEMRQSCKVSGFQEFISKPVTTEKLTPVLRCA
jgi:CheY-like chemotaxis protein